MKKRNLLLALCALALVSCNNVTSNSGSTDNKDDNSSDNSGDKTDDNKGDNTDGGNTDNSGSYSNEVYEYEEESVDIYEDFESQSAETFDESSVTIDVSTITDSVYTISEGGIYILEGTNSALSIVVNSSEEVTLILNGVNITASTNGAISVEAASSFVLHVASATKNYLSDSSENTLEAVLYVAETLNIEGEGYLIVQTLEDVEHKAIHSEDEVIVEKAHIDIVYSADHGLNGKKGVTLSEAKVQITSDADGIHSKKGGFEATDSVVVLETLGDGVDVADVINLTGSSFYIVTTGSFVLYDASLDTDGSIYEDSKYILENGKYKKISSDDMSRYSTRYYLEQKCKGIKSESQITINSGFFQIDSTDDSIASDVGIDVLGGEFNIKTYDQGINSDGVVNIGSSEASARNEEFIIKIFESYEGIQGSTVNFYDGYTYIQSSDDGINATSDDETVEMSMNFYTNSIVNVTSGGDGIDSNGDILVSGGTLYVSCTSSGGDGIFDYGENGTFKMTSGTLFGLGTTDMMVTPTATPNMLKATLSGSFASGNIISVALENYEFSAVLQASYSNLGLVIVSDKLEAGQTATVLSGITSTNSFLNNFYVGSLGQSGGNTLGSATISSGTTTIGSSNQGGPNGGGGEGPGQGGNPGGGNRP